MKNITTNIILLFFSILASLIIAELSTLFFLGPRLTVEVEETGLYFYKPNQRGWYYLDLPQAKINNLSYRGENTYDLNEKKTTAFIGDSITFGWGLEEKQT